MVVGATLSGKSQIIKTLKKSIELKNKNIEMEKENKEDVQNLTTEEREEIQKKLEKQLNY